jgi:predicted AAA+ superfamily ATPase
MNLDEIFTLSKHFIELKYRNYQRYFVATTKLEHRLSLLLGQRGVGKTTSLIQYLLQHTKGDKLSDKILYVQADHFLLDNISIYEIAEQFNNIGGEFIAFDEIHKYLNWSQELKSIYDTFPKLKILASGSSALEIYKGSHDLSRRAIMYSMVGMSFREYLELHLNISFPAYTLQEILNDHEKIALAIVKKLESKQNKVLREFKRYLQCGYYPYFFDLQKLNLYFISLEQNLHTTIESDLVAIYPSLNGNSIKKIEQLLMFIASAVPFVPNWKNLKTILEIGDERTLKTYFRYLEDVGLVRSVTKESNKLRKLELPEKIYLNNTNQYYALSLQSQNIGTIRETFFASMLSQSHTITIPAIGDFLIDKKYTYEVGGKKKGFEQIKSEKNAYLACDDIEIGINKKIPLWLFGFLY